MRAFRRIKILLQVCIDDGLVWLVVVMGTSIKSLNRHRYYWDPDHVLAGKPTQY